MAAGSRSDGTDTREINTAKSLQRLRSQTLYARGRSGSAIVPIQQKRRKRRATASSPRTIWIRGEAGRGGISGKYRMIPITIYGTAGPEMDSGSSCRYILAGTYEESSEDPTRSVYGFVGTLTRRRKRG